MSIGFKERKGSFLRKILYDLKNPVECKMVLGHKKRR